MKLTPLDSLHHELGGKMVPFAGYSMPVKYSGTIAEHKWVRESAGLFDISHMGQFKIFGKDCPDSLDVAKILEGLIPSKITGLPLYKQKYTVLTNLNGGVIDDIMITNMGYFYFMVANGSRKEIVYDYLESHLDGTWLQSLHSFSLLALQGPKAIDVLKRFIPGPDSSILSINKMKFMTAKECIFEVNGYSIPCLVSRSGYTGEDGFEISVPNRSVEIVARGILGEPEVLPIGLGARDSLRLEAGFPLYGHELTEQITPIEAGLEWVIRKNTDKFYPGAGVIPGQMFGKKPILKKRVGLIPDSRAPIREGAEILVEGKVVGEVTSGGFSPILNKPIAMGYIQTKYLYNDSEFTVILRNKTIPIKVTDLPFIKKKYFK